MANLVNKLMCSTKFFSVALAGGLALATFGAATAHADSTDELLELLRKKGALSKKEYAVIKSRHQAEKATSRGTLIKGEAGAAAPRYVTALDKGIGVRIPGPTIFSKDGATSIGDVDVTLSGNLNAFYVQNFRDPSHVATVLGGNAQNANSASVRGGLLPAAVILDLSTKQEGFDISGTLGIFTGINNVNSGSTGLNADSGGFAKSIGTPGVNIKLAYLKVGTNGFGTFEAGRDFGLFGQDILTFDQNELAVGFVSNNLAPGQVSLGQFGSGYIVSDFTPQFRYTTPDFKGFTGTFSVETPYDATTNGAISGTSGGGTVFAGLIPNSIGTGGLSNPTASGGFAHDAPKLSGRLKYTGALLPNVMVTAWATGTTQNLEGLRDIFGNVRPGGVTHYQAYAGEAGAKVDVGAAELIGYGYYGKGVGNTALFFDGLDEQGQGRESYGFLVQASYTFFNRLTIAGGYGKSFLAPSLYDKTIDNALTALNLKTESSYIGTVRYKVTKWLNLVGQYSHGTDHNRLGQTNQVDSAIGGAQIFF